MDSIKKQRSSTESKSSSMITFLFNKSSHIHDKVQRDLLFCDVVVVMCINEDVLDHVRSKVEENEMVKIGLASEILDKIK